MLKLEIKRSLYDELPLEVLAGFYYYINLNIDNGILSDAMHSEIKLIECTAKTRGISLEELHKQGSQIIEMEKKRQGQA